MAHLSDDAIRQELEEVFGLVVETGEKSDPDTAAPILRRLLDGLRRGGLTEQEQSEIDMGLSSAGISVGATSEAEEPEAEEGESEEDAAARVEEELAAVRDRHADELPPTEDTEDFEGFDDELELPEVEIPILLEQGPLASGILMMEAMLTEAKAGYITAQIDVLEQAINEEFSQHERVLMIEAASKWQDASGLPDVPAAYQALVVHRATQARREG